MVIILEGCDKTGKTTLADNLAEEFNLKVIKTSQPKTKDPAKEYLDAINKLDPDKDYLFDRFYVGEMVYGPIYREKGLENDKFKEIEQKLAELGTIIIYCWQDHNIIAQNFIRCKEEYTNIEDIEKIDFWFRKVLHKSELMLLYWNYKIKNFAQIHEEIRRLLCST